MEPTREQKKDLMENKWKELAGKRIVLSGTDGKEYQSFFQELAGISAETGNGLRVIDGTENALEGDLILLFARPNSQAEYDTILNGRNEAKDGKKPNREWDVPFEDPINRNSWEKAPNSWKRAGNEWQETLELLGKMQETAAVKVQSVLLVSGNECYGKIFGIPHALKETELGYLSHTDSEDTAAQCMRTAEHFAIRMAAEEQFPVKIVRIGEVGEGNDCRKLLADCVTVLLHGKDGEIYNLSTEEKGRSDGQTEENSEDIQTEFKEKGNLISGDVVERIRERKAADRKIIQFPAGNASDEILFREQEDAEQKQMPEVEVFERPDEIAGQKPEAVLHSPLAPLELVTDTEKADKLGE